MHTRFLMVTPLSPLNLSLAGPWKNRSFRLQREPPLPSLQSSASHRRLQQIPGKSSRYIFPSLPQPILNPIFPIQTSPLLFSSHPLKACTDLLHSYLGLAALSTMREPDLKDVDSTLCISVDAKEWLEHGAWKETRMARAEPGAGT